MRILHTADWHLGDRLGRIDRTDHIRRAVERVRDYCLSRQVDVLVVAGDLFSERCRSDHLRDAVAHLRNTFHEFLTGGGAIVAITGNHDNETFCRTLKHVMDLAAPGVARPGSLVPPGRFYLAPAPTFLRLQDRQGVEVQFVLLPYPTEQRYLKDDAQKYASLGEKHQALHAACLDALRKMTQHPNFRADCRTVLAAHLHVRGAELAHLFRITPEEDILFQATDLPTDWDYIALGHIHRPQFITAPHIRYCGSIERLDLGEKDDAKSVTLFEIGKDGVVGDFEFLPLDATPFMDVEISDPKVDLPRWKEMFPEGNDALVRCLVGYQRGTDDLGAIVRELHGIFPHCYAVDARPAGEAGSPNGEAMLSLDAVRENVLSYLTQQLQEQSNRSAVLALAEKLLAGEAR